MLFQALGDAGDGLGQRRLAEERRLLAKAAPESVPAEPWIVQTPPAGDELASIIILCCNELAYTRQCLESVVRYTRRPYELIVVDNGSTDGTAEYLQPWEGRQSIARRREYLPPWEGRQSIARRREYLSPWEGRQSIARRREPLEPDAGLFDQAPAGAAVNLRGQPLPPQPGLKRGRDAFHPGAHAAWLCTPAPPGLRTCPRTTP